MNVDDPDRTQDIDSDATIPGAAKVSTNLRASNTGFTVLEPVSRASSSPYVEDFYTLSGKRPFKQNNNTPSPVTQLRPTSKSYRSNKRCRTRTGNTSRDTKEEKSLQWTWSMKAMQLFFESCPDISGEELVSVVEVLRDDHIAGMYCMMPGGARKAWMDMKLRLS
jgi:hypothetical protein